jgi:hypothetical protein
MSPDRYGEAVRLAETLCVEIGRDPAAITFAHYLWVRVGESYESAIAGARAYLERSYQRSFSAVQVPPFCAAGAADDLRGRVMEYAAAGCQYLVLKPACEPEELADQSEALAQVLLSEVLTAD